MKVDFSTRFKDLKGALLTGSGTDKPPEHLGEAAATALVFPDSQDRDFSGKAKKYSLAMRIVNGGEIEITPEEATTIKTALATVYGPVICGQAEPLLNG